MGRPGAPSPLQPSCRGPAGLTPRPGRCLIHRSIIVSSHPPGPLLQRRKPLSDANLSDSEEGSYQREGSGKRGGGRGGGRSGASGRRPLGAGPTGAGAAGEASELAPFSGPLLERRADRPAQAGRRWRLHAAGRAGAGAGAGGREPLSSDTSSDASSMLGAAGPGAQEAQSQERHPAVAAQQPTARPGARPSATAPGAPDDDTVPANHRPLSELLEQPGWHVFSGASGLAPAAAAAQPLSGSSSPAAGGGAQQAQHGAAAPFHPVITTGAPCPWQDPTAQPAASLSPGGPSTGGFLPLPGFSPSSSSHQSPPLVARGAAAALAGPSGARPGGVLEPPPQPQQGEAAGLGDLAFCSPPGGLSTMAADWLGLGGGGLGGGWAATEPGWAGGLGLPGLGGGFGGPLQPSPLALLGGEDLQLPAAEPPQRAQQAPLDLWCGSVPSPAPEQELEGEPRQRSLAPADVLLRVSSLASDTYA